LTKDSFNRCQTKQVDKISENKITTCLFPKITVIAKSPTFGRVCIHIHKTSFTP